MTLALAAALAQTIRSRRGRRIEPQSEVIRKWKETVELRHLAVAVPLLLGCVLVPSRGAWAADIGWINLMPPRPAESVSAGLQERWEFPVHAEPDPKARRLGFIKVEAPGTAMLHASQIADTSAPRCEATVSLKREDGTEASVAIDSLGPRNDSEGGTFCGITYLGRRGTWVRLPASLFGVSGWMSSSKLERFALEKSAPCHRESCAFKPFLCLMPGSHLTVSGENGKQASLEGVDPALIGPKEVVHFVRIGKTTATLLWGNKQWEVKRFELFDASQRLKLLIIPPAYD